MEQLMALGVEIGDLDSTAKSLAALKTEMAEEKAARVKTEVEADTLARAVEDLKKMTDRFAARIPNLEERIKHLDNKVLNGLTELRTKELNLERTTKVNEDYKSQNSRLIKKLESKSPISFATWV
jgi:chromosome segregation ATPase